MKKQKQRGVDGKPDFTVFPTTHCDQTNPNRQEFSVGVFRVNGDAETEKYKAREQKDEKCGAKEPPFFSYNTEDKVSMSCRQVAENILVAPAITSAGKASAADCDLGLIQLVGLAKAD